MAVLILAFGCQPASPPAVVPASTITAPAVSVSLTTPAPTATPLSAATAALARSTPSFPTEAVPAQGESSSNNAAAPGWWPQDLQMAPGTAYQGESDKDKPIVNRLASWTWQGSNLDTLRDWLVKEAEGAGYSAFVSPTTNGAHSYSLIFIKGLNDYDLELFGLPPSPIRIGGNALEVVHLKTSGAVIADVWLPVSAMDRLPNAPFRLVASLTNRVCPNCRYAVTLTLSLYKGAGKYETNAVQVNPGEDVQTGNYGNPSHCAVVIQDEFRGSFECQGLEPSDKSRTIDVSASWEPPVP